MAFDPAGLNALSYANGFTLWHYRSADRPEAVDGNGYFDQASSILRAGDFVFLNVGVPDRPKHIVRVVATSDGARVTVRALDDVGRPRPD